MNLRTRLLIVWIVLRLYLEVILVFIAENYRKISAFIYRVILLLLIWYYFVTFDFLIIVPVCLLFITHLVLELVIDKKYKND